MKNALQQRLRFRFSTSIHAICFIPSLLILILALLSFETQAQNPVLKHAYTFNNGTADDNVGTAHGVLNGGKIINGEYVAHAQGHCIFLPADKIKINTYQTLSLEAYFGAGHFNAFYTMLSYFGNSTENFGINYIFQSPANGGHTTSAISCKNDETPWTTGTVTTGPEVKDLKYHHMVSTFDNHLLKLYIDGNLVSQQSVDEFPNNTIAHLSNQYAYLCRSGYRSDATWFGSIDQFNIYEGILDAATIEKAAKKYKAGKRDVPEAIQKLLSDVLSNPGYRPESELASAFLKNYKLSNFAVYPTVIRTPDSTTMSTASGQAFTDFLTSELHCNATFQAHDLDPGELEGKGQFDFFNNDMKNLSAALKTGPTKTDYHIILEILLPPRQSDEVYVFGIHILILNSEGKNAFSFLLNSHHDYFSYNHLVAPNANPENLEALKLKCTKVAAEALRKQIEYAEGEVAK